MPLQTTSKPLRFDYVAISQADGMVVRSGTVNLHHERDSAWWLRFQKHCAYNNISIETMPHKD